MRKAKGGAASKAKRAKQTKKAEVNEDAAFVVDKEDEDEYIIDDDYIEEEEEEDEGIAEINRLGRLECIVENMIKSVPSDDLEFLEEFSKEKLAVVLQKMIVDVDRYVSFSSDSGNGKTKIERGSGFVQGKKKLTVTIQLGD